MKDTVEKDKRRKISLQNYKNYHDAWKLSHKYSSRLIKHIGNENFYDLCAMYYSQYMNEINNRGYNNNKNKNYIQIWNTMINTGTRESIKLLHQTNVQKTS